MKFYDHTLNQKTETPWHNEETIFFIQHLGNVMNVAKNLTVLLVDRKEEYEPVTLI